MCRPGDNVSRDLHLYAYLQRPEVDVVDGESPSVYFLNLHVLHLDGGKYGNGVEIKYVCLSSRLLEKSWRANG